MFVFLSLTHSLSLSLSSRSMATVNSVLTWLRIAKIANEAAVTVVVGVEAAAGTAAAVLQAGATAPPRGGDRDRGMLSFGRLCRSTIDIT